MESRSDRFAQLRHRVAAYYTRTVIEHGASACGVDWKDADSQQARFDQLLRVCDGASRFSLLDYGCGYGALLDYLAGAGVAVDYRGYDISDTMIAAAIHSHPGRASAFVTDDAALSDADFVIASGVFNVKLSTPDDEWHEYMRTTVHRMAALARRGVAFNALTRYNDVERRRADLHYADPLAWFDYCKRHLSRFVTLLHDYPLYEFTIIIRW